MSLNIINRFVYVIEMNCVLCDVLNELTFHYILYHLQVSNGQEALHYIWGIKYCMSAVMSTLYSTLRKHLFPQTYIMPVLNATVGARADVHTCRIARQ